MKKLSMPTSPDHHPTPSPAEPSQGASWATREGSAGGGRKNHMHPDPEVPEKKKRRRFTAKYKLQVLQEADKCDKPGQIGALLRREGLYSTCLTRWRRQRDQGLLKAMDPKKRGRKPIEANPLSAQVAKLQKENERLRKELWKAAQTTGSESVSASKQFVPNPARLCDAKSP